MPDREEVEKRGWQYPAIGVDKLRRFVSFHIPGTGYVGLTSRVCEVLTPAEFEILRDWAYNKSEEKKDVKVAGKTYHRVLITLGMAKHGDQNIEASFRAAVAGIPYFNVTSFALTSVDTHSDGIYPSSVEMDSLMKLSAQLNTIDGKVRDRLVLQLKQEAEKLEMQTRHKQEREALGIP